MIFTVLFRKKGFDTVDNDIMVSVCCATYNHENYIRKALNSILMQKVNFKYEILIGEDCSTDNSRKIIMKYAKKYPDIIKPFYREKNMGSLDNNADIYKRAKGRYMAVLETDDFWTDDQKLQKQVDFLENNPDFIAVSCRLYPVDAYNKILKNVVYPESKRKVFSHSDYRRWMLPGQTSTILCRNIKEINDLYDDNDLYKAYAFGPGDKIKILTLMNYGKIYCGKERMCAYRYITEGGFSFSATNKLKYYDYMRCFSHLKAHIYKNDMNKEVKKSIEFLLFEAATATFFLQKEISFKDYLCIVRENRYLISSLYWFVRHVIKRTTEKTIDKLTGLIHI